MDVTDVILLLEAPVCAARHDLTADLAAEGPSDDGDDPQIAIERLAHLKGSAALDENRRDGFDLAAF